MLHWFSTGRWFSRRFTSSWRGGLVLVLLCLAVYVPGQAALPPVDRDESRFAQASRQMVQSGDYVVPRIQDQPRLNKPPLIYWAQAAAVRAFGDQGRLHEGIWVYRLPSMLAAIGTVLLVWRLGAGMLSPQAGWLAASMLAVAPVFAWEARQARADQLMVLTVVATQLALWEILRRSGPGTGQASGGRTAPFALLFWLALSAGILVKGPMTPMIAALTAVGVCVLSRSFRWLLDLRPGVGVLIVIVTVGPWVWLVAQQVGWTHYLHTIVDETLGRASAPKEGHWAPPGYHLVLLPVLFWPGSLLTAAAVVGGIRQVRAARRAAAGPDGRYPAAAVAPLFLLSWILPAWIIFELVATKLPHYTMPLYPALALLSAHTVVQMSRTAARTELRFWPRSVTDHVAFAAWVLIGVVLVIGLPLAAGLWLVQGSAVAVAAAAGPVLAAASALLIAMRTRNLVRTQFAAVLAVAAAIAALCGVILPRAEHVWLSPRLVAHLHAADPEGRRPIAIIGYHEDSMLFHTRGRAQRLNAGEVDHWIATNPRGLLVLPVDEADARGPGLSPIGRERGLNYTTGRVMDLVIAEPGP